MRKATRMTVSSLTTWERFGMGDGSTTELGQASSERPGPPWRSPSKAAEEGQAGWVRARQVPRKSSTAKRERGRT
jgi:hypothetical protein